MKFPESNLAHKYLDGLSGLEIGGAAHNPFGLNTKNVDYTTDLNSPFKNLERQMCGEVMPVDLVTSGWNLPVEDSSQDFVVSSHVLEHAANPISVLYEWYRVVRDGGFLFIIVPERDIAGVDKGRPLTSVAEMFQWYEGGIVRPESPQEHHTVWKLDNLVALFEDLSYMFDIVDTQSPDDKAGNGCTIVVKVKKNV